MDKPKLWAFGCSNTFGQCLDRIDKQKPSKKAWPNVLADKLNIHPMNKAQLGNSNRGILYNALENIDNISVNDLVVLFWTYPSRTFFWQRDLKDKITKLEMMENMSDKISPWTIGGTQTKIRFKAWIKYFFHRIDLEYSLYENMTVADHILKKNTVFVYHVLSDVQEVDPKWLNVDIIGKFRMTSDHYKDFALDSAHPGKEQHKFLADQLYTKLTAQQLFRNKFKIR